MPSATRERNARNTIHGRNEMGITSCWIEIETSDKGPLKKQEASDLYLEVISWIYHAQLNLIHKYCLLIFPGIGTK